MAKLNSTTITDLEITGGLVINGIEITPKSSATYTPSASAQTIAAGQYLVGAQTIAAIPSNYIVPSGNIELSAQSGTNVTAKATASVRSGSAAVNNSTITPTFSRSGTTITVTGSASSTATVSTSGWISSVTSGTSSIATANNVNTYTIPSADASMPNSLNGSGASVELSGTTLTVTKSGVTNNATVTTAGWLSSLTGSSTVTLTATVTVYDGSYS